MQCTRCRGRWGWRRRIVGCDGCARRLLCCGLFCPAHIASLLGSAETTHHAQLRTRTASFDCNMICPLFSFGARLPALPMTCACEHACVQSMPHTPEALSCHTTATTKTAF
jgi:hypothetical protein